GRYMFTDQTNTVFTSGNLSNVVLNDEMFLVDQEIITGFDSSGLSSNAAIGLLLAGLPVAFVSEASPFLQVQSWGAGTNRGSIIEAMAVAGDCFSPWFGNDKAMHMIRTFNPANKIPQFDWDSGNQVIREGISETSNILTAPNRFMVTSNSGTGGGAIVGI